MKTYVIKAMGKEKKNVSLINSEQDIPEFLRDVVVIKEGKIVIFDCIEGHELCALGSFIAWEKDETTTSGWNVWYKANGHETLISKDGKWYEMPKPVRYEEVDWEHPMIPDFMSEADIEIIDEEIILHAPWGDQKAKQADGRYAFLAYADSTFALLSLESDSAKEYYFCDEAGNHIAKLVE